jgi:hypothetical protein
MGRLIKGPWALRESDDQDLIVPSDDLEYERAASISVNMDMLILLDVHVYTVPPQTPSCSSPTVLCSGPARPRERGSRHTLSCVRLV